MKRIDEEILQELRTVESKLSPENLCQDGMLSRSRVAARRGELTAERSRLVKELGREPSFSEIWNSVYHD